MALSQLLPPPLLSGDNNSKAVQSPHIPVSPTKGNGQSPEIALGLTIVNCPATHVLPSVFSFSPLLDISYLP